MPDTDRFKPGDQIEYICHDQDPAAPTGGWVPGTFRRYVPRPAGTNSARAVLAGSVRASGPARMQAIVIPRGRSEEHALTVPIRELRFAPPAPGPLTQPPPPGETGGDVMPAVVNGVLVVSAFRVLPSGGSAAFTWLVILRDQQARRDAPDTYTVTRVRWAAAAPGVADGEWQDLEAHRNEGFRGLAWMTAARTFARVVKLEAG